MLKQIYISPELHKKLKLRAIEEGISITLLVHKFLEKKISLPLAEENKQIPKQINTQINKNVNTQSPIMEKESEPPTDDSIDDEPKPMCDKQFCKSRSEGKYRIVTNAGEEELTMNLCTFHWHQARKEAEVKQIE